MRWGAVVGMVVMSLVSALAMPSDATALGAPPPVGPEQEVKPSVVRIGDSIHVTVTVNAGTLALPQLGDTLGPFDVLGSELGSAGGRSRLTVHLAAFDVGSLEIPSFEVPVTGGPQAYTASAADNSQSFRTRPYRITVESLLPADSAAADTMSIRAAHPPLELPRKFLWKVALGYLLVTLALGLLGWWLYRRWKNRPVAAAIIKSEPIIVRPAELVALESLDLLMAKGYALRGLFKEHYTEAMDIVRLFIQRRLGIDAPDMTSYELLSELSRRGSGTRARTGMASLLDEADLVKFARQTPTVESAVALVESARGWIRETHAEETAREAMSGPPQAGAPASGAPTVGRPPVEMPASGAPTAGPPPVNTPDTPTPNPPRSNEAAS